MQVEDIERIINDIQTQCSEVVKRIIKTPNGDITSFYIKQLTDLNMLSEHVIKPIMCISDYSNWIGADDIAGRFITCNECSIETDENLIVEELLRGITIILISWDNHYLAANLRKIESKDISQPELTYTIRGPKDCFTENFDVNLSLIRYRIKDAKLKIKTYEVGDRTKSRVAVTYIEDIANDKILSDICQRIESIKVDGILESGELQQLLQGRSDLFPLTGIVERSDMACGGLLEGKIIIFVEGSGLALIAPKTFIEFLWSSDDVYDNKYAAVLAKILRILSITMGFTLGSLYIALVSFNTDILPADYILTLAKLRANVPFNAFTNVLLLEIVVEILRESLLRVPKQIGSAIGIVGAIIIGQAAISSGIFDPLILIICSLSFLASFAIPDYTIMNPFRILKFFLMVFTAVLGLFGFTFGLCFALVLITSENSFGIAYSAPCAPFNRYDFLKSIFYSKKDFSQRPDFTKVKNKNFR